MNASVHIGINVIVLVRYSLYHYTRFLCGGSIVEVYERPLVYLAFQYGEILTVHALGIWGGLCLVVAEAAALAGIEFTAETVFDKVRNLFAKFLVGDILQDVADEGMLQK